MQKQFYDRISPSFLQRSSNSTLLELSNNNSLMLYGLESAWQSALVVKFFGKKLLSNWSQCVSLVLCDMGLRTSQKENCTGNQAKMISSKTNALGTMLKFEINKR